MRVGLVLGGGAVQGAAWLEGALAAVADRTGWNPGRADVLVGTSAGAWQACALAAGVPPWLMAAQSAGEVIDDLIPGTPGPGIRRIRGRPPLAAVGPGSWPLVTRAVRRRTARSGVQAIAGWVPRGRRDSGVAELVRLLVPSGWPSGRRLWCVACDYRTGERTVFGRDPGPADVADAVAASCAVPGYFEPVRIDDREYVDGGVHSASNLDLLAGRGLDVVVCVNPMSSSDSPPVRGPVQLAALALRRRVGRTLAREARTVRDAGTPVLLVQPTRADLAVLGSNWLRASRHPEIVAVARETVAAQLRDSPLRPLLDRLPASPEHEVRRPDAPRERWPALVAPPLWNV